MSQQYQGKLHNKFLKYDQYFFFKYVVPAKAMCRVMFNWRKLIYSKHLHNSKYMILGSLNTSLFDYESDQYRHILEIVMDFDMEETMSCSGKLSMGHNFSQHWSKSFWLCVTRQ